MRLVHVRNGRGTDPVTRMARSADLAIYTVTALAAGLGIVLVGLDPLVLLILAAVAPLALDAAGRRVHQPAGGLGGLAAVAALQYLQAPKALLLLAVVTATWVALRSASPLVNGLYTVAAVGVVALHYQRADAFGDDAVASGMLFWVAALGYGLATGFVLRRTRELAEELAGAQQRLVHAAADDERRRIAQDVHDLVAHSLAVALLNVTGARRVMRRDAALADDALARADEALARAEAVGRDSLNGIRHVVGLLRTDDPAGPAGAAGPLPAAHDLAALVEGYRRSGLDVTFEPSGDLDHLDPVAGSVLFRTVREGLANVLHHADGAPTRVQVTVGPSSVQVVVANALPPGWTQPDAARGMGLSGVVERITTLGGTVTFGADNGTWRLAAVIPATAPAGPAVVTTATAGVTTRIAGG